MDPIIPPSQLGQAQSPSGADALQTLHLIFPAEGKTGETTCVRYSLIQETLKVSFAVTTSEIAPEDTVDDEIYNRNVVEIFICTTSSPGRTPRPYYEFEVSPYNQKLKVLIDINGKFDEKWKTENFRHSAAIRADRSGWDAMLEIPLKDLGWNGDPATISGNAFAILGAARPRRFYSAYLPAQQHPDFHLPAYFKPFPLDDASSAQSERTA